MASSAGENRVMVCFGASHHCGGFVDLAASQWSVAFGVRFTVDGDGVDGRFGR